MNATCHRNTGAAEGSAQYYNQRFKTPTHQAQQNANSEYSPYTLRRGNTSLQCEKTAHIWLYSTDRSYAAVFQLCRQMPPAT